MVEVDTGFSAIVDGMVWPLLILCFHGEKCTNVVAMVWCSIDCTLLLLTNQLTLAMTHLKQVNIHVIEVIYSLLTNQPVKLLQGLFVCTNIAVLHTNKALLA